MEVGDYFKINISRKDSAEVIYQAVVVTPCTGWVSAKVVHPAHLAEKLRTEGVFKIDTASLDIIILGNPKEKPALKAIYG